MEYIHSTCTIAATIILLHLLGNNCHCAVQGCTDNPNFMDVQLRKAK